MTWELNVKTNAFASGVGEGVERSFRLNSTEYVLVVFSTQRREMVKVKLNFSFSLLLD